MSFSATYRTTSVKGIVVPSQPSTGGSQRVTSTLHRSEKSEGSEFEISERYYKVIYFSAALLHMINEYPVLEHSSAKNLSMHCTWKVVSLFFAR